MNKEHDLPKPLATRKPFPYGYLDRAAREAAEGLLKKLWLDGKITTADHCLLHQALMCLDDLMCEFVERPTDDRT